MDSRGTGPLQQCGEGLAGWPYGGQPSAAVGSPQGASGPPVCSLFPVENQHLCKPVFHKVFSRSVGSDSAPWTAAAQASLLMAPWSRSAGVG